jgi:enamine deaminase RidA (YjgF/YER057c/UK114 family)
MGQTHEGCDFPFESEALNQGHVENENMAYFNTRSVVSMISGLAAPQKHAEAAAKNTSGQSKSAFETYHAGPWEQRIGYSQAARSGCMLYVSGTVGANAEGKRDDLDSQMKNAYAAMQKTLAQYKTDASHVIMERIYTTDMDALIRSQETRKQFYGEWLPAATWVEVKRLYGAADKIEIEVQVALEPS